MSDEWMHNAPVEYEEQNEQIVDPEKAVEAFRAAAVGDEPEIDEPRPGSITLSHGLEIDGTLHKNAEVRELNGADEEALSRLDETKANYAPLFVDAVLRRGVEAIGGVKPTAPQLQTLLLGDRELLFKEILFATYGTTRDFEDVKCANCGGGNDMHVDLEGVIDIQTLGESVDPNDIQVELRDGRSVTLRYPTGGDQMFVYEEDRTLTEAEANTRMLSRCIEAVNGRPVHDGISFARKLGALDRRALIKKLGEGPSVRFKEVEVPCTHDCGNTMKFQFSWAELLQV